MTEQLTASAITTESDRKHKHDVRVTVLYLPATKPFQREYAEDATVGTVQTDAMSFFGVRDFQDRNTHRFFLEYEHRRLTNLSETLHRLVGEKREAEFHLIEEVTPGGDRIE